MNLPRVTSVISPWSGLENIPDDVLANAAARGTAVHEICNRIAAGEFVVVSDPALEGYVKSFRRWFDSQVAEVILAEERLIDHDWGYTGQIDLLVRTKGDLILLCDLKTPVTAYKGWRVQLSAYHNLVTKAGHNPELCGSLQLHPEGRTPRMNYYENTAQDFHLFTQALNLHRFFNGE